MYPLAYFARHGQTDWNAEGRLQGQADTDLNARGRLQAAHYGHRLREILGDAEGFDFVASPMKRTRQTMEILRAQMGLDPAAYRTDPRLMELNFGDWQGHTYSELEALSPGAFEARNRDKWNFLPPGAAAESYAGLARRIAPFLAELRLPTVCVAHGGVIRALFLLIESCDERQAADMPVTQDSILRLQDGRLEWLD